MTQKCLSQQQYNNMFMDALMERSKWDTDVILSTHAGQVLIMDPAESTWKEYGPFLNLFKSNVWTSKTIDCFQLYYDKNILKSWKWPNQNSKNSNAKEDHL